MIVQLLLHDIEVLRRKDLDKAGSIWYFGGSADGFFVDPLLDCLGGDAKLPRSIGDGRIFLTVYDPHRLPASLNKNALRLYHELYNVSNVSYV